MTEQGTLRRVAHWLPAPDETGDRVALAARCIVFGAAMGMLAAPYTVGVGCAAAIGGAIVGVLGAERARQIPFRLAPLLGICVAGAIVAVFVRQLLVGTAPLSALLGPELGFRVGEIVLWSALAAAPSFWLRMVTLRRPDLVIVEVAGVAAALVAGFAAHRDGMVSRPLWIGDWAWSRDIDPAIVLLLIGGGAALLLAVLLVTERQWRRLLLHFGSLLALGGVMMMFITNVGLPQPARDDLGLTGEGEQERAARERAQRGGRRANEGQGEEGQREQRRPLEDLEFRDEYSGSAGVSPPVAIVQLRDDYSPPTQVYYFRQAAFSQYNGRRLVATTRDDVDLDIVWGFSSSPLVIEQVPPLGADRRELRTRVALLAEHTRPFALDSPIEVDPLPNPDPMRFQRLFEVTQQVQVATYRELLSRAAGDPAWTQEQWDYYTTVPADPAYRTLAESLIEALPEQYASSPLAKALVIKQYLDKNGIYSRKSRHATTKDPTASFLFGDLTGYCVHFAHAATYLFRSVGLPARVAAGYASPEEHRSGGSDILLRGANAHAWPEIYLEGYGWVTVDLTPEQSLDEALASPDQRLQSMLGEMMRKRTAAEQAYYDERRGWLSLTALRNAVAVLLAAACLIALLVKIFRRLSPRLGGPSDQYRLAYRTAMDRLADVGVRRQAGESRERFATRAAVVAPSFRQVTAAHLAWALGSRRLTDPDALAALCEATRAEIGRAVPIWRRALGGANPFSWVWVR